MASNIQWMARTGYTARATVYFLVGGLALFSGTAGGKSDTKSAVDTLLQQPFGGIWVGMISVGLMGFVAWRLAQSLGNADHLPYDFKGMATRAALFGSAMVYVGLAYHAVEHALASAPMTTEELKKTCTMGDAAALRQISGGPIGIGFIIGGFVTIAKGVLRKYEKYQSAEANRSRAISLICVYGLSARGLLFVIVGGFFVYAAFTVDSDQAGSIADALNWIRSLPFGGVLYSIVAVGLASFGASNLVQACYRVVHDPEMRAEVQTAKETVRRAH